MLASVFIVSGLDVLANPEPRAKAAKPVVDMVASVVPFAPADPVDAVRLNAAVHLGAGVLLAAGVLSRLRRTHNVIVVDTSDDLEHPVMKAVFDACDTLVFISGPTADTSLPVTRAIRAGRFAIIAFQIVRASAYPGSEACSSAPRSRLRSVVIAA